LKEALDAYTRIGMPRHCELVRSMLAGMQTERKAKPRRHR